ncbi:unnamed protein product [Cyprideis torosa]|uniref:Uncharacterized protein n=1 Tax=Cyprideis torosa TaxID=163714 RepID=A0A7R8ZRU8_9CRUS|nr:unnamed protein product [Cyprideis torosa]CAG0904597.1 unnamed protein product [Cyprideis torosa]
MPPFLVSRSGLRAAISLRQCLQIASRAVQTLARKTCISVPEAPSTGPYSPAVVTQGLVFTSGQLGLLPDGTLVEGGVVREIEQTLKNLEAVLKATGVEMGNVVKCTVFLKNMSDFNVVNEIYARAFPREPPARSCFQVGSLPRGASVEIEAVAVYGKISS